MAELNGEKNYLLNRYLFSVGRHISLFCALSSGKNRQALSLNEHINLFSKTFFFWPCLALDLFPELSL